MFNFFKRNNSPMELPNWADFFTPKEYQKFIYSIKSYFNAKEIDYTINSGVLNTSSNDFGFNELGLVNIAQICKSESPRSYKKIIEEHFNSLIEAHRYDQDFNKIISDFDKIKKHIGVRLYHNSYINQLGKEMTLGKEFSNSVYAMLVFDLPHSVINIQPHQIEPWGKSFDELFNLGLENIRAEYPNNITEENLGDFNIWFVQSDHFYAPNIVYDLNTDKRMIGAHGSLLAIPHRHCAMIYPIETLEITKAINKLIPIINGMNIEGPGSISNKLYWRTHGGDIIDLPYKLNDKSLNFIPPENFVEMLNQLR